MKIGFVLDDGLDKPDGVQQYITTLGDYFIKQGHTVHYLVGETRRRDNHIHSLAKNVRVRFNGNALSVPLPASSDRIKQLLTEEDFDVIHVQTPYSPFMGAKIVKHAGSHPVVIGTFHILPYGVLSRIGTRLLGLWLKHSLHRFDAFISVSEPAAAFALSSFKIDSQVIPNSVNIAKFKQQGLRRKNSEGLRLLFVGRLVHRKGCKQLIDALQILHKAGKMPAKWRLDVCGSGPMMRELMERARHEGLEDYIEFHGFISDDEKIDVMRHADISIFPSLSGESFGIVLIEAMAAGGGIVLGGRNPGYASVLHEVPESLVDSHDPVKLAAQLYHFIADSQARRQLYGAQQKLVKRFDTAAVGDRILALYEACKKQKSN